MCAFHFRSVPAATVFTMSTRDGFPSGISSIRGLAFNRCSQRRLVGRLARFQRLFSLCPSRQHDCRSLPPFPGRQPHTRWQTSCRRQYVCTTHMSRKDTSRIISCGQCLIHFLAYGTRTHPEPESHTRTGKCLFSERHRTAV